MNLPGVIKAAGQLTCLLLLSAGQAQATQLKVYQYTQQNGVVAFSDKPPADSPFKVLRYDCFACGVTSTVNFHTTPLFYAKYHQEILTAARQYQLNPSLIRAVIHAESGFNPKARSRAGAQGLMQLMPATAKELGTTDVWLPQQNIQAGSAYLARLLQQFNGDRRLALAAYNAGPGAVSRYDGVPPFAETRAYLERVDILLRRYERHSATL
jgi:soluble lytic murein transglycosylase-like protein